MLCTTVAMWNLSVASATFVSLSLTCTLPARSWKALVSRSKRNPTTAAWKALHLHWILTGVFANLCVRVRRLSVRALRNCRYWIEIIKRPELPGFVGFVLNQTMIRVKDPARSLPFYCGLFNMVVVGERHFGPESGDFSLYFLASGVPPQSLVYVCAMFLDSLDAWCASWPLC
jgi:hypothetical protein